MKSLLFILFLFTFYELSAQQFGLDLNKENELQKATKQVGQFFHRFNAEENPKGERIYEGDPLFRNSDIRKRYLEMLISTNIEKTIKNDFISDVTKKFPFFIDFHKPGWFAEVKASFDLDEKKELINLFLSIQHELIGSKWVITNIFSSSFYNYLTIDTNSWNKFIHPMSHELDFMNLNKIFQEDNITPYLKRDFQPDYLTIMAYEHKKGNLKFQSIENVKFHFLQVPDWYFEINNLNPEKGHSGWMITRLMRMNDSEKDAYFKLIVRDKD